MAVLSDLHDDLLRRILHFVPAKEAASTTALARRWRFLWPSSGAVNLVDKRSKGGVFLRDAEPALAASRAPYIRRLSFHLEGETQTWWRVRQSETICKVLSTHAARRVEELRVIVSHPSLPVESLCMPNLAIGSLPLQSLRVLDISTCHCQPHTLPSPATRQPQTLLSPRTRRLVLPRLEAMRLHRCTVGAKDLQAMIDAAPLLTTLQLYEVQIDGSCKRLHCPRVTNLVLADLAWRESSTCRGGMALHAPMMRTFTYRGFIRRFLLEPPATEIIANVYLHFVSDNEHRQRDDDRCRLFWLFVNNFINAKTLKLRLAHLEHIIVADKRTTAKPYTLGGDTFFSNLHRLDLQAFYTPGRRAGGVAFATFLRRCPVISALRLTLSTEDGDPSKSASHVVQEFLDEDGKEDLCNSVDQFIRPQ